MSTCKQLLDDRGPDTEEEAEGPPFYGEPWDESLCVCGRELHLDGPERCVCGQCPGCATLPGKADDPLCELCAEFLRREHEQLVRS